MTRVTFQNGSELTPPTSPHTLNPLHNPIPGAYTRLATCNYLLHLPLSELIKLRSAKYVKLDLWQWIVLHRRPLYLSLCEAFTNVFCSIGWLHFVPLMEIYTCCEIPLSWMSSYTETFCSESAFLRHCALCGVRNCITEVWLCTCLSAINICKDSHSGAWGNVTPMSHIPFPHLPMSPCILLGLISKAPMFWWSKWSFFPFIMHSVTGLS